jgi:hypothetical protein
MTREEMEALKRKLRRDDRIEAMDVLIVGLVGLVPALVLIGVALWLSWL